MEQVRGITLAQDETVVREYEASSLADMSAKGYVIVTNLRLLFTGSVTGPLGKSLIVRDTKIDNISGVVGGLTHKKSLLKLIIGIIIALIGLISLFNDAGFFGFIILLIGAWVIYSGTKQSGSNMYVSVMAGQTSPAISVSVEAATGIFSRVKGHDAFLTVAAAGPGANTEQMILELGALVQDIQTMGNLAIDKWKNGTSTQTVAQPTPVQSAPVKQVQSTTVQSSPIKPVQMSKEPNKVCECGTSVEKDAAFCPECGKSLTTTIFG